MNETISKVAKNATSNKKRSIWLSILIIIAVYAGISMLLTQCRKNSNRRLESKIEAAIANRDFGEARTLTLQLVNDDGYKNERLQSEKVDYINRAELNYVLETNGIADAYFLANELNIKSLLIEILSNNIVRFCEKGQIETLIQTLSGWNFEYSFSEKVDHISDFYITEAMSGNLGFSDARRAYIECNIGYNNETNTYNTILDAINNYCIINEDIGNIKKTIKLYRPVALEISKKDQHGYYNIKYKKEDKARKEAIAKAKQNGINI